MAHVRMLSLRCICFLPRRILQAVPSLQDREPAEQKAAVSVSALIAHGLEGKPVVVVLEKGIDALAAQLGVLYAGGCYVPIDPVATYDVATSECDIATALDEDGKNIPVEIYDNGVDKDDTINATATKAMLGGQGTQIAVYDYTDANDNQVNRLVIVDTYLAEVTDVVTTRTDAAGHPSRDALIELHVYNDGKTMADKHYQTVYLTNDENFSVPWL